MGISKAISRKRCKIAAKLVLVTDRKSYTVYELSIDTKMGDLEQRNGFILRYFTEFGSFRGALRKGGWQNNNYGQFTITMSIV